jgi:hypothetical protein
LETVIKLRPRGKAAPRVTSIWCIRLGISSLYPIGFFSHFYLFYFSCLFIYFPELHELLRKPRHFRNMLHRWYPYTIVDGVWLWVSVFYDSCLAFLPTCPCPLALPSSRFRMLFLIFCEIKGSRNKTKNWLDIFRHPQRSGENSTFHGQLTNLPLTR